MSAGSMNQWEGQGEEDTCGPGISTRHPARTDPPDKRAAATADETAAEGGTSTTRASVKQQPAPSGGWSQRITGTPYQQQQQQQQQHHQREQQQAELGEDEKKLHEEVTEIPFSSVEPVWIQQHQQQRHHHPENTTCGVNKEDVTENESHCKHNDTGGTYEPTGGVDYGDSSQNHGEVSTFQQDSYATVSAKSSPSSTASPSAAPRLAKCKRQDRVRSSDEPPNDLDFSKDPAQVIPKCLADENSTCKVFLEGNPLDLSPRSHQRSLSVPDGRIFEFCGEPEQNGSAKDILPSDKRSSLEQGSVRSLALSDDTCNEGRSSGKKKLKKKKDKHDKGNDKSKSNLSLTPSRHSEGADNHGQGQGEEEEGRPPSTASSTKGRRGGLTKRGIGMFPSSNWRRLRNTLKAANEMQGPKKHKHTLTREDSFLKKFSTRNHQNIQNASSSTDEDVSRPFFSRKFGGRFVIQHDGNFMFYWLGVVTVSVLYNLWTCIAREAFKEIQQGCPECWYSIDALFDAIYICDIIVQFRTGYLDQGLMVYDSKKLRKRYTKSKVIYFDFISLMPLDLLQFAIGVHPMIRFPRFLKVYRSFRFLHMLESRTAYPNFIRVANLTHILFLGAHWFAAFYYMISEAEGFEGDWAYPKPVGQFADVTRKYLMSLFWSTLTLTTIGDLPPPDNNNRYVFVIVSYLIGVFVFATIVGQVGNVINNRNASRQEFERLLDGAKIYMQTHNVPHNLQKRVQRWYDYVWSRGRLNGCDINSLGLLPDKLKTELAIHVNLETLKKVTIFQECQPEFLHDLVLKMKAYIFTPGDLICRRGEVAREMFIIADGVVEIISESGVMLKRMGAGDFFGEIGILNLDGGINRRTADVRSVGYLELFVLSREDVLAALKDHPEAESIIRDYGQRRLREVEAHRQKVKPLKCRGSTDQQGYGSGAPHIQNRFFQTLRSLNPAVRRQSAQVNHTSGSPQATGQAGNSAEVQRCVPQKGSPANKVISSLANASVNAQSGFLSAAASIDRQEFLTFNRLPANLRGRRRSFTYLRSAYARFRNVFQRRRGQRRSVDIADTKGNQEMWDQLQLTVPEEHAGALALGPHTAAYTTGCQVTLNIEDCSDAKRKALEADKPEGEDKEKPRNVELRNALRSMTAKRGSILLPGFGDPDQGRGGRGRKLSEPVTYMAVCTEDLDEQFLAQSPSDDVTDGGEDKTPDVGEEEESGNSVRDGEGVVTSKDNLSADASCIYKTTAPSDVVVYSSASSNHNLDTAGHSSFIHDTDLTHCEDSPVGETSTLHSDLKAFEDISSGKNRDSMDEIVGTHKETMCVTGQPENDGEPSISVSALEIETGLLCGEARRPSGTPQNKSFIPPSSVDTALVRAVSPPRRSLDRTSPVRRQDTAESQTFHEIDRRRSHESFGRDADSVLAVSTSALRHASPSPFTLSCHCDPADNFRKFIGCRLPESFHHKLLVHTEVSENSYLVTSGCANQCNGKIRSTSDSGAHQETSYVTPSSPTQNGRSQSFPTLVESVPTTTNAATCWSRCPSSPEDVRFSMDDINAERTARPVRFRQESAFQREGSGKCGRSHPMSIIQQPTSDLSYQQITAQIQIMQAMVDKRLSHLEDVYSNTTARLEKLTAAQETLVRLLKQQLLIQHEKAKVQVCPEDDDLLTASRV